MQENEIDLKEAEVRMLAWLGRHATEALIGGVFIGLILPDLANVLQGWLSPLVFVFTAATFLKVDVIAVARAAWRQPLLPSLLLIWSLVAVPIVVAGAIHLFRVPSGLAQALIVWAASPSMTAAIVFAAVLGLDVALAVTLSTLSMVVVPLTGPRLTMWLVGMSIGTDALMLTGRIAAFIGAALAVAWALRRLVGRAALDKRANEINGAIIILLVLFGISLTAGVGRLFLRDPGHILEFIIVAFIANLVTQIASSLLFGWAGSWRSATAALLSGNRNMSVLCANLGVASTPDIMLFFATSHIPIYVLPWILRKVYRRATNTALNPVRDCSDPGNRFDEERTKGGCEHGYENSTTVSHTPVGPPATGFELGRLRRGRPDRSIEPPDTAEGSRGDCRGSGRPGVLSQPSARLPGGKRPSATQIPPTASADGAARAEILQLSVQPRKR
jgi:BASS family bile acid:Na+ symporter